MQLQPQYQRTDTTYKELKLKLGDAVIPAVTSTDTTYKELKLRLQNRG